MKDNVLRIAQEATSNYVTVDKSTVERDLKDAISAQVEDYKGGVYEAYAMEFLQYAGTDIDELVESMNYPNSKCLMENYRKKVAGCVTAPFNERIITRNVTIALSDAVLARRSIYALQYVEAVIFLTQCLMLISAFRRHYDKNAAGWEYRLYNKCRSHIIKKLTHISFYSYYDLMNDMINGGGVESESESESEILVSPEEELVSAITDYSPLKYVDTLVLYAIFRDTMLIGNLFDDLCGDRDEQDAE